MAGFSVPVMEEYDDELLAIEMTVVSPPFLLDFASAIFDQPPDFIEDEGHTFEDFIRADLMNAPKRCWTYIMNWRPGPGFICRICIHRM